MKTFIKWCLKKRFVALVFLVLFAAATILVRWQYFNWRHGIPNSDRVLIPDSNPFAIPDADACAMRFARAVSGRDYATYRAMLHDKGASMQAFEDEAAKKWSQIQQIAGQRAVGGLRCVDVTVTNGHVSAIYEFVEVGMKLSVVNVDGELKVADVKVD